MKIIEKSRSNFKRYTLGFLALGFLLGSFLLYFKDNKVEAADATKFNPSNIIDDLIFYDYNAMSASEIQSFLNGKVSSCDSGYTCLKNYSAATVNKSADAYCNGYTASSSQTAAQMIYGVAQSCKINPQVLLVLLQKEMGLVTHKGPGSWRYDKATGFACPDSGSCDTQYYGLFNQLYHASRQYRIYQAKPSSYNYVANRNNTILWNPTSSCGSSTVFIENQATAGLYNYTPYRPNQAALNAGYGEGDGCSSYGNRNFWLYFTDWFGSTQAISNSEILSKYNSIGGIARMGHPTSSTRCDTKYSGCYQFFEKGAIYWSSQTGSHSIGGGIFTKWSQTGREWGSLGYPTSDELYGNKGGGAYQTFEKGKLYYLSSGNTIVVLDEISIRWGKMNSEWGSLGYPINDTQCGTKNSGCYQFFNDGHDAIYWSSQTGSHSIGGGIFTKWSQTGREWGSLGYPTSDELYGNKGGGAYQTFEKGTLYWSNGIGIFVLDEIMTRWKEMSAERGKLGYPINDTQCGTKNSGCYQFFNDGHDAIYWSSQTGSHSIGGGIFTKWSQTGREWGSLGYPTSDELYDSQGAYQNFQNGTIRWSNNKGAWIE